MSIDTDDRTTIYRTRQLDAGQIEEEAVGYIASGGVIHRVQ